jgi:acyl carrier protein
MAQALSSDTLDAFIRAWLSPRIAGLGVRAEEVERSASLTGTGLIDSSEFLELLTAVERHFGLELDLSDSEPAQFTTISGLTATVLKASS